MGDSRRHAVFAQFLVRNFPRAEMFVAVADGKGVLARELADKKKTVIVIENSPRLEGRLHKRIRYTKGWFTRESNVVGDVIVGMHPDEATAEIVLFARRHRIPFAVVPCCCKGHGSNGVAPANWLRALEKMAGGCRKTPLRFSGKNVVLYKHDWN